MKKSVYVVDTSYLVEFYRVDGHYNADSHQQIWQRFEDAKVQKNRIYVPVPVIFELANHIAHIDNGDNRLKLARQFAADVQSSLANGSPFNLVPCKDFQSVEALANHLGQFASEYATRGLGLTDTSVYLQAKQLYDDYQKFKHFAVHIWTRDLALKAMEPDTEDDYFV